MPKLLKTQKIAYEYLRDDTTKYIVYGGGAGGGKSWLGAEWLLQCSYHIPTSRWFIGRNNIKDTLQSFLVTFNKVAKVHNFTDYKPTQNGIEFKNGSFIEYLDLSFYPYKDPLFERLGSKEYTGGWIEEAGQIHHLAFDVLKSRIGRHLNNEYKLTPKLFVTCNPKKNWLYKEVYKPFKQGNLSKDFAFIQSLSSDNYFLTSDYIESLKSIKDKATKERLLYGNWEYDNDPNALIEYDAILDLFTNSHVKKGKSYISTDIALQGSDRFVIGSWSGLNLKIINDYNKTDGKEVVDSITSLKNDTKTPNSRIVYDSDGVGNYLSGYLKGAKGFINNGKPVSIKNKNIQYQNLKTQCQYKLAEYINERKIYISAKLSEETKKLIIEELEQLKSYQTDRDGKLKTVPKHILKQTLGRSPDFLDMLTMRMLFELKPKRISRTATV